MFQHSTTNSSLFTLVWWIKNKNIERPNICCVVLHLTSSV